MANARPDPTLAEFQTGPPDSGYSSLHRLPDFNHTYPIMAGLFDQQPTCLTRHRVIAGRGGSSSRSTWSCVRQNVNFVVQSVCDAPIINTSYQNLPFGSGHYPDKLLFHQALRSCLNFLYTAWNAWNGTIFYESYFMVSLTK